MTRHAATAALKRRLNPSMAWAQARAGKRRRGRKACREWSAPLSRPAPSMPASVPRGGEASASDSACTATQGPRYAPTASTRRTGQSPAAPPPPPERSSHAGSSAEPPKASEGQHGRSAGAVSTGGGVGAGPVGGSGGEGGMLPGARRELDALPTLTKALPAAPGIDVLPTLTNALPGAPGIDGTAGASKATPPGTRPSSRLSRLVSPRLSSHEGLSLLTGPLISSTIAAAAP
mmetsp:Transcript_4571/g.14737  ORF Transcript_4571/g.14737 Transcript_4571/m.14737 type:complete len:233 (+) Transcript_4571:10-708(+)